MSVPAKGFCIRIIRDRVEKSGSGSSARYRTVGSYSCYMDGKKIADPMLEGASVEPRGPGDNGTTGTANARRIAAGKYPLGSHSGAKYASSGYHMNMKPRPGLYVHDTDKRSAILIHQGIGFKASIGCINLTASISGPTDLIGTSSSHGRMDHLIDYLKANVPGFPSGTKRIPDCIVLIEGEPS